MKTVQTILQGRITKHSQSEGKCGKRSARVCVSVCVQVKSVNLSDGEQLSIRGVDERGAPLVLANQSLLVEGQVIRSPTNTMSVFYRSAAEGSTGTFQLHYQSES